MSDSTLKDIEERFVYRDMSGVDGKDVTYLLNKITELESRLDAVRECEQIKTGMWITADKKVVPIMMMRAADVLDAAQDAD